MEDILFSYYMTPSYGFFGKSDGGFSVEIYSNRQIIYKTYVFDEIEKTRNNYLLSQAAIENIKKLYKDNQNEILSLDESYDNDILDGVGYFFTFCNKKIITWDIDSVNEKYIKKIYNKQYIDDTYVNNLEKQRFILYMFKKITKILKIEGFTLNLNKFKYNKWIYLFSHMARKM